MKFTQRTFVASLAIAAVAGVSIAATQQGSKDAKKPASPQAEMQLPPGMTMEDMQTMKEAATPGAMHTHLMKGVGTWTGVTKSWSAPDTEPTSSTCTSTVTALLDGRFVQTQIEGEMPGLGMFKGMGINGYDNVSKQFQGSWIDNSGTEMMQGTGKLSADGKQLTWNFNF